MPYVGSRNAVIAVLGIVDLLITSLGAQGPVKLTVQVEGCESDCPVRRKLLGQTKAPIRQPHCPSDEDL